MCSSADDEHGIETNSFISIEKYVVRSDAVRGGRPFMQQLLAKVIGIACHIALPLPDNPRQQ
jgi:hypothetical protein